MKTILVPTDFSENAFVAAEYACALANATAQRVRLLHVYIALYAGYGEEGNSVKQIKLAEAESSAAMENLLENLRKAFPGLVIEGECIKGFMIDEVTERLKGGAHSMVVMGTKGVTNITESVFGSTTYEVIKKSPVPVLVVPIDTPDFSLDRVGFFTAFGDHELDALLVLQQITKPLPHLSMVHLFTKGDVAPEEDLRRWQHKLAEAYPEWNVSHHLIPVEKVDVNAVVEAAKSEGMDLLVFARPHKSFFQQIFTTSLTKAVANYPAVPSLFIKA